MEESDWARFFLKIQDHSKIAKKLCFLDFDKKWWQILTKIVDKMKIWKICELLPKTACKNIKMPNFHEFLKFQDHSIIQLKMAIFADSKQNILETAQNIVLIFGIKWKHDVMKTITKLYCPKRSGSFKNEGGSFKNWNFFKKKFFFKNFYFSILAILSWKKGKENDDKFFSLLMGSDT